MKKNKVNTLSFRLWLYFIAFAIGIFAILWLMQVVFLQAYYSTMKKNEVIKLTNKVEEIFLEGNYEELIDDLAYKNISNIFIFDTYGNTIYDSNTTLNVESFSGNVPNRTIDIDENAAIRMLENSPSREIKYTIRLDKFKSKIFVYGKVIPYTNICIVMVSSIDPIDATISILAVQLVYITVIALIISSIISIFLSKRLSKPISNMNEMAKRLALGDYSVKFEKCGYNEIDNLVDTLNDTTKKLKDTDETRRELMANVSHDLKTPLTMIKAYSEMIRDLSGENKEKREEHLKTIIDETDRLTNLVNDMMDLSKIETGLVELNKEEFNISDVIKNIVKKFEASEEGKHKRHKFILLLEESQMVFADKSKIEQVIYNLISNAIKYSEYGKTITVKLNSYASKVKIQIIDEGAGIKEEDINNIWNRYYRSNKNFSRNLEGSGLGLCIVKNILNAHKENFGVTSQEGKGSNFWFEITRKG